MAFVDGSSSGSLSGMRWAAYGASTICEVIAVSPSVGIHVPSTAVPLNVVVANTGTGGTDVQFQVATDAAFASVVAAPSTSAAPNGPLTRTATGLSPATGYYWRARGADAGTTGWGPWSATMDFVVDLNAGKAFGYVDENLGVTPTLYAGQSGYVDQNVGVELTLYAGEADYVFANYGVQVTIRSFDYEYVYEGDVSTHEPTPHVWFVWRAYGFANDEVWTYGHGFGNPQSEYAGHHRLRPGPAYSPAADVEPVVNEWYLQEAILPDAYTEDRKIYAGSGAIPPFVNQQVEIIRWIAPDSVVPTAAQGATNHKMYVTHGGKFSNLVNWLMYPTIPAPAATLEFGMHTSAAVRVAFHELPGTGIVQGAMAFSMPAYIVSRGRAERRPSLLASASTDVTLGSWDASEGLAAALAVNIGSTRRWLADEDRLVSHPEAGTGVVWWEPSLGSNTTSWRLDTGSMPYVDPVYELDTRLGSLVVPVMVFPGDAWAALTANLPPGPAFTIAVVAVLQGPPAGRGTVLASFAQGSADVGSTPLSLSVEGSALRLDGGGTLGVNTLQERSKRPVIILMACSATQVYLSVLDLSPATTKVVHPKMTSANSRLWLSRSEQSGTHLYPMAMDVLEVDLWNTTLTPAQAQAAMTKLDGIYGVSG